MDLRRNAADDDTVDEAVFDVAAVVAVVVGFDVVLVVGLVTVLEYGNIYNYTVLFQFIVSIRNMYRNIPCTQWNTRSSRR